MRLVKYIFVLTLLAHWGCSDDNYYRPEPPRDEAEVYEENITAIEDYLNHHFLKVEEDDFYPNYKKISFDTIADSNADKTPLMEEDFLKKTTIKQNDIEYTLYYLEIRKGNEEESKPTFSDKVTLTYKAEDIFRRTIKEVKHPRVVDFERGDDALIATPGVATAVTQFHGGSEHIEHPDGTVEFSDDFGIGTVFVPSGLAYFNNPPLESNLLPYEPFIVSFQLLRVVNTDDEE